MWVIIKRVLWSTQVYSRVCALIAKRCLTAKGRTSSAGTLNYMAPELLEGHVGKLEHPHAVDVYRCEGCMLLHLCTSLAKC